MRPVAASGVGKDVAIVVVEEALMHVVPETVVVQALLSHGVSLQANEQKSLSRWESHDEQLLAESPLGPKIYQV